MLLQDVPHDKVRLHNGEAYAKDKYGQWYIRSLDLRHSSKQWVWLAINIDRVPKELKKTNNKE